MNLHVLIVEDCEDDALLLLRQLKKAGYEVASLRVEDGKAYSRALEEGSWDLVLADYSLPAFGGIAALEILRGRGLDTPFIMVSGTINDQAAVAAMKAGAQDYVMKDNLSRLIPAVERELAEAAVRESRRNAERAAAMARGMAEEAQLLAENRSRSLALMHELVAVSRDTLSETTIAGVGKRMVSAALRLTRADVALFGYDDRTAGFGTIVCEPDGSEWPAAIGCSSNDAFALYDCAKRMGAVSGGVRRCANGVLVKLLLDRSGQPNGVLIVASAPDCLRDEEEALLSQLAGLASLGLQHIEARQEAERRAGQAEVAKKEKEQLLERQQELAFELAAQNKELRRLHADLESAARLRQSLIRVGQDLVSTLDFDELLRRAVTEGAASLGADAAVLEVQTDYGWLVREGYGLSESLHGLVLSEDEASLAALALEKKKVFAVEDARIDPRVHERTRRRYRMVSSLVVPLLLRDEMLGVILFVHSQDRGYFRGAHLEFARNFSVLIALALENARLYEEQKNLSHGLEAALLNIPEQLPGLELSHVYRSATDGAHVGGDFYDVFEAKHGRIGLLIGDVSGHGLEAARIATLVKDTVHAFAHQFHRPQMILRETNRLLREKSLPGFVTAFLGLLDAQRGQLMFSSAGHPAPIVRSGSRIQFLESINLPLGIFPDVIYQEQAVHIPEGAVLLFYTDGVTEARGQGELFGEERLASYFSDLADRPVKELPCLLLEQATLFSEGQLRDDVALLAVHYLGTS